MRRGVLNKTSGWSSRCGTHAVVPAGMGGGQVCSMAVVLRGMPLRHTSTEPGGAGLGRYPSAGTLRDTRGASD